MSSAVPNGLSDPFDPAQGGWIASSQIVDPYTGITTGGENIDTFAGGQNVDPYSGVAAEGDNLNAFAGGQNVDPLTGVQNGESFTGGGGAATASTMLAFGVEASAVSGGGSTWTGFFSDSNGVVWNSFVDSDGNVSYSPAGADNVHIFAPLDLTESALPTPGTPPPPDFVPDPAQPTPAAPAPTDQAAAAAVSPQAPANSLPAPPPSPPPDPPAPPPAPIVPFNPQADSPFASWLLYGGDTPIRDFFTNDANLQVAQDAALGIAVGAGAAATGGLLLEAAPTVFAGITASASSASAAASAAAPLAAGAAGIVAANPGLPEEIEEGVESNLPALESSLPALESNLQTLEAELENSLQSVGDEAAPEFQDVAEAAVTFQDRVRQAEAFLRANPDLIQELGGSHTGAQVSANQLGAAAAQFAEGNPGFARALGGNAMEALVNAIIQDAPPGAGSFIQIGGANRIDFIGVGAYEGFSFELTTEAGVLSHSIRAYVQEPGAMIFTYTLPFE